MNVQWIKEREIQPLKGCQFITVLNDIIYYVDKKRLLQQSASESPKTIEISFPVFHLMPSGGNRIFIKGSKAFAWYDRDSNYIHKFDQKRFSLGRINRSMTIGISSEVISYSPVIQKHFLIDLLTGQTIVELEGDARFHFGGDNLYFLGKEEISRIDLGSGKVIKTYPYQLSRIPLSDGTTKEPILDKALGEVNGKLLLSGSNERYLSIDLEGNTKSVEISNPFFEMRPNYGIFPCSNQAQVDISSGEIVGLYHGKYWSVDVDNNNKVHFEDLAELLSPEKLRNARLKYLDRNLLYVVDQINGGIGVYDRDIGKVIWSYDLLGLSGSRPLNLNVYEKHLLVHDSSDCVHVFVRP